MTYRDDTKPRATFALPAAIILVLALLGGGCPENPPPGACNTSADCPVAGHACIQGTCQPVTAVCSGDGDCAYGERCVDGSCQRDEGVCLLDTDCSQGYRCETLSGRCVLDICQRDEDCEGTNVCDDGECKPPEQNYCINDSECSPPSTICEGGSCVPGCQSAGCTTGYECNTTTGRCVPDSTCGVDTDCDPPGTICEGNECVAGCQSGSCPIESYCDIRTGRCVPGCTADSHCDPPSRICQGGSCADGCGITGCGTGLTCDSMTGRCIPDEGCSTDSDCGPPTLICEAPDCVAGCLSTGCGFEEHCNETTGRCQAGCVLDSDCNPPSTICIGGSCLAPPDCLDDGCLGDQLCDFDTRLCEPRGTASLGSNCADGQGNADHTVCASDYCVPMVPPPEGPGPTCSATCTAEGNCPTGFGCLGLAPSGASVCLSWSPTASPGAGCSSDMDCRSGLCHNGTCQRLCQHDRECTAYGQVCGIVIGDDYMKTACIAPVGSGNTGSSCNQLSDCRRFICVGTMCADPCHTSEDCPIGWVCSFVDNGVDTVRACLHEGSTGDAPVGETCNPATGDPCRSKWCLEIDAQTGEGRCIDVCANQSNCPTGFRCAVVMLGSGEDAITAPLCLPR